MAIDKYMVLSQQKSFCSKLSNLQDTQRYSVASNMHFLLTMHKHNSCTHVIAHQTSKEPQNIIWPQGFKTMTFALDSSCFVVF